MSKVAIEKVAQVVNGVLDSIRERERKMGEEIGIEYRDPCADCRVIVEDDHVVLTYDGAGYDYFSYHSEFGGYTADRDALREALDELDGDIYFEDRNNWSLSVYVF